MVPVTSRPKERAGAMMVVVALHVAALTLLLAQKASFVPPLQKPGVMTVSLEALASPKAPPPSIPSDIIREAVAEAKLAIMTDTSSDSEAIADGGCQVLAQVSDGILNDPAALLAANNAPPETRSIAEAVVMWNQNWIEAASSLQEPLWPARAAVERSLASLPVECLDEPIAGPRLIPLPTGMGTTFLVFGSGEWTWRQVGLSSQPTADDASFTWPDRTDPPPQSLLDFLLRGTDRKDPG